MLRTETLETFGPWYYSSQVRVNKY